MINDYTCLGLEMNDEIARYKKNFLTIVLLLSYSYLHVKFNVVYTDVSLEHCIDLTARLPFAQRLLVPGIAHFISRYLPLNAGELFFLFEFLFISLLYFSLNALMRVEFSEKPAKLLSWLFILLLPLVSVINYRFTTNGIASFFYPWDTATLFFMCMGFLLCLKSKWIYFVPWIFLSTFNRESSVLLVLLIPALYWQQLDQVLKPICFSLIAFIVARFIVIALVYQHKGAFTELFYYESLQTLFERNYIWLFPQQHILVFIFCFAGLPVAWFTFYDYIPLRYRPIRYVALFYFVGLLMVGNEPEARIYGEILILLYLPVCLAMTRWISNIEPEPVKLNNIIAYIDRFAIIGALLAIIICAPVINSLIIWRFSHQIVS